MRGTGDGIFIDTQPGRKSTGDKIMVVAVAHCGDDHKICLDPPKRREIWPQAGDLPGAIVHAQEESLDSCGNCRRQT